MFSKNSTRDKLSCNQNKTIHVLLTKGSQKLNKLALFQAKFKFKRVCKIYMIKLIPNTKINGTHKEIWKHMTCFTNQKKVKIKNRRYLAFLKKDKLKQVTYGKETKYSHRLIIPLKN